MPGEKLRTKYEGSVVYLADPRAMHDPGKAFKENPHKRLALDLVHEGSARSTATWANPATATTSPAHTSSNT